jgi:hypothetical protein
MNENHLSRRLKLRRQLIEAVQQRNPKLSEIHIATLVCALSIPDVELLLSVLHRPPEINPT